MATCRMYLELINNINQSTVPRNPFDSTLSVSFVSRHSYCPALGEAGLMQAGGLTWRHGFNKHMLGAEMIF